MSKTGFQQPTQYNEAFTLTRRTSINPLLIQVGKIGLASPQYNISKRSVKIKRLWRHSIKQLLQKSRADLRNLKTVDLEEYIKSGICNKSPLDVMVTGESNNLKLEEPVLKPAQMYSQVYPVSRCGLLLEFWRSKKYLFYFET